MFQIVKNLPVPEKNANVGKGPRVSKYPFEFMEMGDCMVFHADNIKDANYKKIYGAAQSYARRLKKGFTFRFGKIEEGKFGCWKIPSDNKSFDGGKSVKSSKKSGRNRANVGTITKEMLFGALEHEGTLVGASRLLGISSRTLSRLKQKFEMS
ncbi:MAG: hypothetical protein RLZ10_202 [Bacteroidota bacterium]|jgi:hypothetical protein